MELEHNSIKRIQIFTILTFLWLQNVSLDLKSLDSRKNRFFAIETERDHNINDAIESNRIESIYSNTGHNLIFKYKYLLFRVAALDSQPASPSYMDAPTY